LPRVAQRTPSNEAPSAKPSYGMKTPAIETGLWRV
jgi:hypothetical protein